ncbi:alpha/beta fold hydrolase [Flavilitoribacter nigricans]|uniref:alpha/beta fold hydrolase n=1 Tax=Flavilitoribacter nigricans TaxID=70997 RepID=UPI001474298C|nr:alpha/beta hydrolase [Flavilitoribacter nigricans]
MKQPEQQVDIEDELLVVNHVRHGIRWLRPAGSRSEPVLVFLHDALGSIPQWKDLPERMVRSLGLPAVLIERQGHGQSSPLVGKRRPDYLHYEAHTVLPAVLDALGVTHPVLIGHSDGGTIALLYASRFTPLAVVSIAAHIFVEEVTLQAIGENLAQQAVLRERLYRYHGEKTGALFEAWADTWQSEAFRDFNIESELTGIKAPILIVQSEDDEYGTELQVRGIGRQVSSGVKRICLLERGGHMLHLTRPGLLAAEITGFLSEVLPG